MEPINPITQIFIGVVSVSCAILPVLFVLLIIYVDKINSRNRKLRQLRHRVGQAEIWPDYPYVDIDLGDERHYRR